MLSSVYSSSGSVPVLSQPILDKANVSLEEIRNARGDINEIRMILKGDIETMYSLFKQATEAKDAVMQIQLSHTLSGMRWGKDSTKKFSTLVAGNLEMFAYYPKGFILFTSAYNEAMGLKSDGVTAEAVRVVETFRLAANAGYLPAFLELICKEWDNHTDSYGFAVQLLPFVGKGDKLLDYYFGKALKNGCQARSKLYQDSLPWIDIYFGIPIGKYRTDTPLGNVNLIKAHLFNYDSEQIKSLLNKHKIKTSVVESFVEHPTEGREVEGLRGDKLHGFRINTLSVYREEHFSLSIEHRPHPETFGNISVREDTFEISQTFENPKIKPVIEFIENVMTRTGFASSAYSWLIQIKSGHDHP